LYIQKKYVTVNNSNWGGKRRS